MSQVARADKKALIEETFLHGVSSTRAFSLFSSPWTYAFLPYIFISPNSAVVKVENLFENLFATLPGGLGTVQCCCGGGDSYCA